jgi:phage head maturation protease
MRKKMVESAVGVKTTEETARHIDEVLKDLPKGREYEYRRKGQPTSSTLIDTASGERCDVSRVTTREMDRDFEIVQPEGLDLDHYRLNPVVLFGHDADRPVGKALWIKADQDGVLAKTQYTPRPEKYVGEWLPDFVWAMVQADVLRGKSVGYLPLEVREPDADELAANPGLNLVVSRALLLEFSVVTVPANPTALVESISKGQSLGPWVFNVLGRVRKPAPAAKAAPKLDRAALARQLAGLKLDPERIADAALAALARKWEV